jgi:hypothetical protein
MAAIIPKHGFGVHLKHRMKSIGIMPKTTAAGRPPGRQLFPTPVKKFHTGLPKTLS